MLEFATEVWSPNRIVLVNDLESVQRTFTRRLFLRCSLSPIAYSARLRFLTLETLELRRWKRDLMFTYKITHNLYDLDKSLLFSPVPMNIRTRNGHCFKIKLPFFIRERKRSTCVSRVLDCWNSLPSEIVTLTTAESFFDALNILPEDILLAYSFVKP